MSKNSSSSVKNVTPPAQEKGEGTLGLQVPPTSEPPVPAAKAASLSSNASPFRSSPTTQFTNENAELPSGAFWSLAPGRLQVTVIGLQTVRPLKRPYVKITLGDQVYQTSASDTPTGDWREGFEFRVGYHAQLFGTCQLDVYDTGIFWDKHIGRAEIALADLEHVPQVFTNYYELWDRLHSRSNLSALSLRTIYSSNIGAIKVMIAYSFQKPPQEAIRPPKSKTDFILEDDRLGTRADSDDGLITGYADKNVKEELVKDSADPNTLKDDIPSGHTSKSPKKHPFVPNLPRQHEVFGKDSIEGVEVTPTSQPGPRMERASPWNVGSEASHHNRESGSSVRVATDNIQTEPSPLTTPSITRDGHVRAKSATTSKFSGDWMLRQLLSQKRSATADYTLVDSGSPVDVKENLTETVESFEDEADEVEDQNDKGEISTTFLESVGGLMVGKETKDVLKAIRRLLAAFGQGFDIKNIELLAGVLILEKFYAELPSNHTGNIVTAMEHIESPAYYYKFTMAAYGWRGLNFFGKGNGIVKDSLRKSSDALSVIEYLSLPKDDLLGFQFRSSKIFSPSHFYCVDRANSSLVLSIRGTMSVVDSLTDLVCEYTPWKGGLVHGGVKTSASWFTANVLPKLVDYVAENPWVSSLAVVGHSLGGAVAAILVMMLVDDGHLSAFAKGFKVKGYAYGPPCCVSKDLAKAFEPWVETYVWETDFTSGICYGSMVDFKNLVVAASEGAKSHVAEILAFGEILTTTKIEPELRERLQRCRTQLRSGSRTNPKLYLPGRVYHMYAQPTERDPNRVVMERADHESFTEFAIKRTMLIDHMPSTYDRAFTRARETMMVEGARTPAVVSKSVSATDDGGRISAVDPSLVRIDDGKS